MRNIVGTVAAGAFLVSSLALTSCTTNDAGAADATGNRPAAAVPGEVNPNAPDAAQQVRTSPGINF